MKHRILGTVLFVVTSAFPLASAPAQGATLSLVTAPDYETGYKRSAFKHWIDADKNGCNTRTEVLIRDAIVKPTVGKNCALMGGKWRSQYDKLVTINTGDLDIDHVVPLKEAWRSGAWAWTDSQREAFANDLENPRALVAVSKSSNRTKGDRDYSKWQPDISKAKPQWSGCNYLKAWIAIKMRYQLTVDSNEASWIQTGNTTCAFGNSIKVFPHPEFSIDSNSEDPSSSKPVNLGKEIKANFMSMLRDYPTVAMWKSGTKNETLREHKGSIEFFVEDPPIGILTEDLNDNCVTISYSTESGIFIYENSTITVTVRCRWVKAESVAGAGWKWREGKSTIPLESTSCARLIEVEIAGIKVLACAPPENTVKPSASPAPTSNTLKRCWVNGYTRSNGTAVKGYYRTC